MSTLIFIRVNILKLSRLAKLDELKVSPIKSKTQASH